MGHDPSEPGRTAAGPATSDGGHRTEPTPSTADPLTRALDVLADAQRRAVLAALQDAGRLSLDALARAVLARNGGSVAEDGVARLRRFRIRLHHVHLPKLDAAGVVDYDPAEKRAALAVEDDVVLRLLDDAAFAER